ncbi:MAG: hypothetical protein BGO11_02830 [Solirubrobacterales bacterium 70-9]|nr:MAG: hypothetical protein BGO11_02830 [Solirubrobacterales bacterium 70-9]
MTYEGRFCTLTDVTLQPRPTRERLEFWLGGRVRAALLRVGRIADGWLGSFVGPDEFGAMVATIEEGAAAAGRRIDDDHYGTTVFAAPSAGEMPAAAERLLGLRPDLAPGDHIAFGAPALRDLLARFVAAGGSKFVVIPIARDLDGWLRELWREAVVPIERQAAAKGGGK